MDILQAVYHRCRGHGQFDVDQSLLAGSEYKSQILVAVKRPLWTCAMMQLTMNVMELSDPT